MTYIALHTDVHSIDFVICGAMVHSVIRGLLQCTLLNSRGG